MIETIREARIAAPVGDVWRVVSDPDRAPDWYSFADRVEVVSGDGVGQRRVQHGRWGHKRSEIDQQVVAFEPERLIAWRHLAERLDGKPAPAFATSTEFRIELTADGDATVVRLCARQKPASLPRMLLLSTVGAREIAQRMTESLTRLERAVREA